MVRVAIGQKAIVTLDSYRRGFEAIVDKIFPNYGCPFPHL
jgi:multidrug resistance efflux pump